MTEDSINHSITNLVVIAFNACVVRYGAVGNMFCPHIRVDFSDMGIYNSKQRKPSSSLQWRHNERDGVSNHRRLHCQLSCCFRRRSKKISKLRVTALCVGNSPVTGEFPAQKSSNAENVSIWWRHHDVSIYAGLTREMLRWNFPTISNAIISRHVPWLHIS